MLQQGVFFESVTEKQEPSLAYLLQSRASITKSINRFWNDEKF